MRRTRAELAALRTEAEQMLAAGMTRYEIQKALGVAPATIQSWLPDEADPAHIAAQPKGARDDVKRLRADGLTFEEIGDRLGITKQRAHQLYGSSSIPHFAGSPPSVRTMRLPAAAWSRLEVMAEANGAISTLGHTAGKASVAALMKEIAAGELALIAANPSSADAARIATSPTMGRTVRLPLAAWRRLRQMAVEYGVADAPTESETTTAVAALMEAIAAGTLKIRSKKPRA